MDHEMKNDELLSVGNLYKTESFNLSDENALGVNNYELLVFV